MLEELLTELVELGKTRKFNGEVDYGANITLESLKKAQKFVGTEEESQEIVERFLEDSAHIHHTLLSICLANHLPNQDQQKALPSIRLLVNLIMRSPQFASRISSECVELLETLLAFHHPEVLCILTKTADSAHLEFQKSPRYAHLLERILEHGNEEMPWVLAYFSFLLEKDYGFVSSCYAEMSSEAFCELLDIVNVMVVSKKGNVHSNNLLFVLNLLELISMDYDAFLMAKAKKEPKSVEERRKYTVEMLHMCVDTVAEMCTNTTEMATYLSNKAIAINAAVDVLDTILHAESLFADFRSSQPENWPEEPEDGAKFEKIRAKIQEEKRYEEAQRKYTDRPRQPAPPPIQRVITTPSLSLLSSTVYQKYRTLEDDVSRIGELKLSCIKAICNLSSLSGENKLATLENGRNGLLSVLQCTSRRPAYFMESCVMRNYSIFCVRLLTDNCQENKKVILNLGQPTEQIIDRTRLLAEFGINEDDVKGAELRGGGV